MKYVARAILFVSVFLHTDGLDAQDDFISAIRLDHWAPGTLVLKDGRAVSGKINYDYANNFIQVKRGDSVDLYNDRIIASLEFDWFDSPEKATFRNLRIDGPERMYRVLFENEHIAFLSYYDVEMESYGPVGNTKRPTGTFSTQPIGKPKETDRKVLYFRSWKERFLVVSATGDYAELGSIFIIPIEGTGELSLGTLMTKKGLVKKLRGYDPAVKGFMEDNNIDLRKRPHIMRVFASVSSSSRD